MWKDYSKSYLKNNRASRIPIMTAALIAALFLSMLCSLFYNFWQYDIENTILKEGDWQGRIRGEIDEEDLLTIQNFVNVEKTVVNKELSKEQEITVDVYFRDSRTIFEHMPLILNELDLEEDAATYNIKLLFKYFIHDPQDEQPPLLMTFYLYCLE